MVHLRVRKRYEKNPVLPTPLPAPTSDPPRHFELPDDIFGQPHEAPVLPHSLPVRLWTLAIWALDFIAMFAAYAYVAGVDFYGVPYSIGFPQPEDGDSPADDVYFLWVYDLVLFQISARCLVFSLAEAQIDLWSFCGHKEGRSPLRALAMLLLTALIIACNIFVGAAGCYRFVTNSGGWVTFVKRLLGNDYGWSLDMYDGAELTDCLMQNKKNASCMGNPNLNQWGDWTWKTTWSDPDAAYGPWGTSVDMAGWSNDPTSPNYHRVPLPENYDPNPSSYSYSYSSDVEKVSSSDVDPSSSYGEDPGSG